MLDQAAHQIAAEVEGEVRRLLPLSPASAATVYHELAKQLECAVAWFDAKHPPLEPIACRPGCAACCKQHVAVSPLELLALWHWLEARPSLLAALRAPIATAAAQIRGTHREARFLRRIACPLLAADGRCQVYEARPLLCRAQTSYVPSACAPPRAQKPQHAASAIVGAGLARGVGAAYGVPWGLELALGLALILEDPTIVERWAQGDFTGAERAKLSSGGRAGLRLPVVQGS